MSREAARRAEQRPSEARGGRWLAALAARLLLAGAFAGLVVGLIRGAVAKNNQARQA